MKITAREMLQRLGAGEPIASVCEAAGLSRRDFEDWWRAEAAARVPAASGTRRAPAGSRAEIHRDGWGIPHVYAETDGALFFAFGYAMAQDRLFQLDYLRRKASGTLAEVLGPEGLELDTIARTIGLRHIAEAEWGRTPAETRALLAAFADGVNAVIEESRERLPIEFDLLGYGPAPWSPVDCLAIAGEFRYYLTVRFPVIVIPELAKRVLGEGPLYAAFLQGEADDESILPPGAYPGRPAGTESVGSAIGWPVGDPEEGRGSNNWVVAGTRTTTGQPLVASDPHIAFGAVSCWYEVHLSGGSFDVAGTAYAGVPAVFFGRSRRVAWGITNNICSQRDLYQERTDPARPGAFLYDGRWEPAREVVEDIRVAGRETVRRVIRFSRNGPIVDDILPAAARGTGPVALRWLGATPCGFLTSLLALNRARSADELQAAVRGWRVPTWSLVFADVDGHIGYRTAGTVPVRRIRERGYRPGWDPQHQWEGLIPFEAMPQWRDPERGWIATANNRPAPDDFPYPLSGTWSSGHRARRIRQLIEARPRLAREDVVRMHQDALSLRAVDCVPRLLKALAASPEVLQDPRLRQAAGHLEAWDCQMEVDRVGAAIFDVFFPRFCRAVVDERFDGATAELLAGAAAGLASELLAEDAVGWFTQRSREQVILGAFRDALAELEGRVGSDMATWTWGRLHQIRLQHVLAGRGELGQLLDRGGLPVKGNGTTVCNTGYDPNYLAPMGANYRLIADLATTPPGLWAVDAQGQSGHPGSPHYADQLAEWIAARYHYLSLDRAEVAPTIRHTLTLVPSDGG
ncbi:MAG TPA: penicillin acylase family protein [Methylomirabilota bacterium]|nr:penicillin acylase family protein [Methylomirabilota bacterium]